MNLSKLLQQRNEIDTEEYITARDKLTNQFYCWMFDQLKWWSWNLEHKRFVARLIGIAPYCGEPQSYIPTYGTQMSLIKYDRYFFDYLCCTIEQLIFQ